MSDFFTVTFAGDLGCVAQVRGKDEMPAKAGLYPVKLSLSESATTFCDLRADGESLSRVVSDSLTTN